MLLRWIGVKDESRAAGGGELEALDALRRAISARPRERRDAAAVLVAALTAAVTGAGIAAWPSGAAAQSAGVPVVSQPLVQPLPSRERVRLSAALARLGRNPRDTEALIDAGDAASALGDTDAAIGFFRRADQIAPNTGRVLAGLAGAMVRSNDPATAIPLFDQAERAGIAARTLAGDRGLAYDLVGDNARAQSYYAQALAAGDDPEIRRRLALSQAIGGDGRGAEATLLPLLQIQDKAAWRTRAFVFAILGQTDAAITVARTLLPADLAASVTPYFGYMPRLTRAQQAAAANFGAFPRASEIGVDDPRIARLVPHAAAGARAPTADQQLVPKGEPLGNAQARAERPSASARHPQSRAERTAALAARTAPPEPLPERRAAPEDEPPKAASAATVPSVLAVRTQPARAASPPAAPASTVQSGATPGAGPTSGAAPRTAGTAAAVPQLAAIAEGMRSPAPAPTSRPSLGEAFRDLGTPSTLAAPTSGAVDVARVAPVASARAKLAGVKVATKPVEPDKPAPPSHPSRIWVQLGVGQDKQALAWDWHKLARAGGDAFKDRQPFISQWGQTNRMLTGPFGSEAAAGAFVNSLDQAGVAGPFIWVSPAGQIVDSLPLR